MPQLTQQEMLEIQSMKNQGGVPEVQKQLGTFMTKLKKQAAICVYDFSVLGGAQGAVNLKNLEGQTAKLPNGAVITSVIIDVITAPTSGGSATISFGAASATDLKGATAIASYTGLVAGVPVGSAATSIKLAADATVTATIATADLTAGKIYLLIEYFFSSAT